MKPRGAFVLDSGVKRVEAAHPYDVPAERGFPHITNTANWSMFWPGHVRLDGA
jgi:hypothetical protein